MLSLITKPHLIITTIALAVVGFGVFFFISNVQESEQDKITIELQDETNDKRKEIRETLRESRPVNRDDASDSLQYFRDRQSSNE